MNNYNVVSMQCGKLCCRCTFICVFLARAQVLPPSCYNFCFRLHRLLFCYCVWQHQFGLCTVCALRSYLSFSTAIRFFSYVSMLFFLLAKANLWNVSSLCRCFSFLAYARFSRSATNEYESFFLYVHNNNGLIAEPVSYSTWSSLFSNIIICIFFSLF